MLMIVAQMLLVYWKKKRYRSYQQVTLFGLWLIPFLFAEFLHFYKLLACWLTWTAGSAYIMYKATRRPVPDKTPRLVYSFFFYSFRVCYSAGLCGYLLILLDFFQLPQALGLADKIAYYGGLLFFFGLYFGVLSRDCSEMCTDRMAATMGYGKKGHMPNRRYDPTVCLLCGDALNYDWALMNSTVQPQHIDAATSAERTVSLSCGHAFHDFCIRCVGCAREGSDACAAAAAAVVLGPVGRWVGSERVEGHERHSVRVRCAQPCCAHRRCLMRCCFADACSILLRLLLYLFVVLLLLFLRHVQRVDHHWQERHLPLLR